MRISPDVKINLGLSILRKRPDGYHDIETLFVPYRDIRDMIEIEKTNGKSSIEIIGGGWDPETDLSWRSYQLLKHEFDLPPVKIVLEKKAPIGAGLGSGSADAAFTLKALDQMFGLKIPTEKLAEYASTLGSDCAFFIYDRPMLGRGRGEILTPYDVDLSDYRIEVALPQGVRVSTKEAYSGVVTREHQARTPLLQALSRPIDEWKDCLVNDFEESVFRLHPQIRSLKDKFYEKGAVYASMSGSGSAVFGLFKDR